MFLSLMYGVQNFPLPQNLVSNLRCSDVPLRNYSILYIVRVDTTIFAQKNGCDTVTEQFRHCLTLSYRLAVVVNLNTAAFDGGGSV